MDVVMSSVFKMLMTSSENPSGEDLNLLVAGITQHILLLVICWLLVTKESSDKNPNWIPSCVREIDQKTATTASFCW